MIASIFFSVVLGFSFEVDEVLSLSGPFKGGVLCEVDSTREGVGLGFL